MNQLHHKAYFSTLAVESYDVNIALIMSDFLVFHQFITFMKTVHVVWVQGLYILADISAGVII